MKGYKKMTVAFAVSAIVAVSVVLAEEPGFPVDPTARARTAE
jgi:hypothetical protein